MYEYDITVLGAGSYGSALAISCANKNLKVLLYVKDPIKAQDIKLNKENRQYLPNIKFPDNIHISSNLHEAIKASLNILIVVPSHAFLDLIVNIKKDLSDKHNIIYATKGLINGGIFISDAIKEQLPFIKNYAALSGPTFAKELASNMPTAVAIAGSNDEYCNYISNLLHTNTFRIYTNHDLIALQLGGAVKNVIAIACGLSDGLGFGANARTALITRGLAEMTRLGVKLKASEKGFQGLSGLGDLLLTCTDNQSRNRTFGVLLGNNYSVDEAMKKIGQVVEGYNMTYVIYNKAKELGVDMPIVEQLYNVLYNKLDAKIAAANLLSRQRTAEFK